MHTYVKKKLEALGDHLGYCLAFQDKRVGEMGFSW